MRKLLLLSIAIGLLSLSGISQTIARLDSSFRSFPSTETSGFNAIFRTIYNPNTDPGLSLVIHDRWDVSTRIPFWNRLCDDSIIDLPNYKAFYTKNFSTGEYRLYLVEQNILYPDGKVHIHEFQSFGAGELTHITRKTEFTYASNGEVETESFFRWSTSDLAYKIQHRYAYTYDSDDRMTSKITEILITQTDFNFYQKEEYEYNSTGNLSKSKLFRWSQQDWLFFHDVLKTYTSTGELVMEILRGHAPDGQIYGRDSVQYEYDQQRRLTLKETYTLAYQPRVLKSKAEYTYSQDGLSTILVESVLKDGVWEESMRDEKTWTAEGDLTEHLHEVANDHSASYLINNYYTYRKVSIEPVLEQLCRLPNPLQADMYINCSKLDPTLKYEMTIYDLQGKRIAQKTIQHGQQLSFLSELKSNLYVVMLKNHNSMILSEKIMIVSE